MIVSKGITIGDKVRVIRGRFSGETGIVVGVRASDKRCVDDLYYEVEMDCEIPDSCKCRKSFLDNHGNVAGGFDACDLELVMSGNMPMYHTGYIEPIDTKTAFLTELQALMRKYDADIGTSIGEDDATCMDKVMMWIQIGDDVVNYEGCLTYCDINADNIMDFDNG